jgi:hypothetical protein
MACKEAPAQGPSRRWKFRGEEKERQDGRESRRFPHAAQIQLFESPGHEIHPEADPDPLEARPPHGAAAIRQLEDRRHFLPQRVRGAGRDEEAGLARRDQLPAPTEIGGDDRTSRGHRLHHGIGKTFEIGGENQEIHRGEQRRHVGPRSREDRPRAEAERRGEGLQIAPRLSPSDDQETALWNPRQDLGRSPQEEIDALLGGQPSHHSRHRSGGGNPQLRAERPGNRPQDRSASDPRRWESPRFCRVGRHTSIG